MKAILEYNGFLKRMYISQPIPIIRILNPKPVRAIEAGTKLDPSSHAEIWEFKYKGRIADDICLYQKITKIKKGKK